MRLIAVIVFACVTGCAATTTREFRDAAERHSFQSTKAPHEAAGCVARNAENWNGGPLADPLSANVRGGERSGSYEVTIRGPLNNITSIADIEPSTDKGSAVTIWLRSLYFWQDLPQQVANGC